MLPDVRIEPVTVCISGRCSSDPAATPGYGPVRTVYLYLSCIIPRALFKPFKQMGWKWRYSEGNHQAINKQNYFFFSNKSSCECFLIYCLCQSLLWAKDEICKDYFRGFLGASPPEAKSYSFLTVLPTTYVLFRYFAFASMCYSLLPIMLNIFDVICQIHVADDFYEKKNIFFHTF